MATALEKLGADPNRYRHAAESLMRRISKQNYLTPIHSGVDLNNFFSLQYEMPIGLYDIAQIKEFVEIDLGHDEIGYDGLNGRFNTLANILYSRDEVGAFGSPLLILNAQLSQRKQQRCYIYFISDHL